MNSHDGNPISPPTRWCWTSLLLLLLVHCFAFSSVDAFYSPSPATHIIAKNNHVVGSALRSSPVPAEIEGTKGGTYLDEKQLEFCKAYLNEHHKSDVLLPFTLAFSELGAISAKKNMWMGGSYSIIAAEVTDITSNALHIEATVQEGKTPKKENVVISLDSDPVKGMARTYPTLPQIDPLKLNHASKIPIDNFCRRMIRLCNIVKAHEATGKMIQMGVQLGGKGVGKVRDDLFLNQVPHSEY